MPTLVHGRKNCGRKKEFRRLAIIHARYRETDRLTDWNNIIKCRSSSISESFIVKKQED